MGAPAELSEAERAAAIERARKIIEKVDYDGSILDAIHDYRNGPTGPRNAYEAAEARAIDSSKIGDAEVDVEYELLVLSQVIVHLQDVNKTLSAMARMDAAERQRFRAWSVAGRDRVVELALEIGRHWREQEGINGGLLDQLEELTREP